MPFPYRDFFTPPAPSFNVTISFEGRSETILAKLDTGADMTAVPYSVITTLGLERISDIEVTSVTGTPENAGLFLADLAFLDFKLKERPLVGVNRPYMLIGRDIINGWLLTLNGPRLQFEIHVPQQR